jgi:hypothetical protein
MFADHFSSPAKRYARHRPHTPQEVYCFLSGLAPGQNLAWDPGPSSGQSAIALADYFRQLIATDASTKQDQYAPKHPKIGFRVERAVCAPIKACSVDLITASTAVHWFDLPDRRRSTFWPLYFRIGRLLG